LEKINENFNDYVAKPVTYGKKIFGNIYNVHSKKIIIFIIIRQYQQDEKIQHFSHAWSFQGKAEEYAGTAINYEKLRWYLKLFIRIFKFLYFSIGI